MRRRPTTGSQRFSNVVHRPGIVSLCLSASLWFVAAGAALAQEPQTRAEALALERQAKSQQLEPPKTGRVERALLALENDRIFERILNPAEGFYPKIGNLAPGSGFALGPAYRHPFLFGDEAHFSAFAAANFDRYWMLDARVTMSELAGGRAFADVHARR